MDRDEDPPWVEPRGLRRAALRGLTLGAPGILPSLLGSVPWRQGLAMWLGLAAGIGAGALVEYALARRALHPLRDGLAALLAGALSAGGLALAVGQARWAAGDLAGLAPEELLRQLGRALRLGALPGVVVAVAVGARLADRATPTEQGFRERGLRVHLAAAFGLGGLALLAGWLGARWTPAETLLVAVAVGWVLALGLLVASMTLCSWLLRLDGLEARWFPPGGGP